MIYAIFSICLASEASWERLRRNNNRSIELNFNYILTKVYKTKTTWYLQKTIIKVLEHIKRFPKRYKPFLYVKKQLRYDDLKKSHFWTLKTFLLRNGWSDSWKNWSSRCPGHTLSSKKNWRKTGLKFFFEPENFFFSESNEILLVPRVHINKCSRPFVCAISSAVSE